jgi:hypothetical protein
MSQNSPMALRGTRFFAFWFFLASAPLRPRIHSVKRFRIRFWIRRDNWLFKVLPGDFYFAGFDSAGSNTPPLLHTVYPYTTLLLLIWSSSAFCYTWKVYSSAIHAGLPSHIALRASGRGSLVQYMEGSEWFRVLGRVGLEPDWPQRA